MLKLIRAAAAALVVLIAPALATAQVVTSVKPADWSAFTDNSSKSAAQLGYYALVTSSTLTYRTWAGVGETEPTGGQYATAGATPGYVILPSGSYIRPSDFTDGTIFTGAAGTPNTYAGIASVSFDIMFACSDIAGLTQTDDSTIAELSIGLASAIRHQFVLANATGINYKQRCGVRCQIIPNSTPQTINGIAYSNTDEPMIEFNKVYTVTVVVGANSSTNGFYRIFLDRQLIAQKMGVDTTQSTFNLGATFGNLVQLYSGTATGYSSGSTIELRVLPRSNVTKGTGWYAALGDATPASNVGTTRQFPTSFTSSALDSTGYPFTLTQVTGTPTAAATSYAGTAPTPYRSRFVWTASSSDKVRVSTNNQLGTLETDAAGYQYVGWLSEYIPTGSAVWGLRSGADSTGYVLAVNYSAGMLREGAAPGAGKPLFALDANKIYGIALVGNTIDRTARVLVFNLTDQYRYAPLVRPAVLSTQWPSGPLGVQSAEYVFGSTALESSTMVAGRGYGLMAGDSFGSTYTYARGTATLTLTGGTGTPAGTVAESTSAATGTVQAANTAYVTTSIAGATFFAGGGSMTFGTTGTGYTAGSTVEYRNTLICTRNNVGFHVAYGAGAHFIPTAWRPGKPTSTDIPDVVYAWSIGRSGLRVEDMGSTTDECNYLRAATVFVPGFGYNSMSGMTAATADTYIATWGTEARRFRDAVLSGGNTLIWPSAPIKVALGTTAAGLYQTVGADRFLYATYDQLNTNVPKTGTFWRFDSYPYSSAIFVGAGDNIHPLNDTEGPRLWVSRLFGNVAGGFNTPGLHKGDQKRRNPRRRPQRRVTRLSRAAA